MQTDRIGSSFKAFHTPSIYERPIDLPGEHVGTGELLNLCGVQPSFEVLLQRLLGWTHSPTLLQTPVCRRIRCVIFDPLTCVRVTQPLRGRPLRQQHSSRTRWRLSISFRWEIAAEANG